MQSDGEIEMLDQFVSSLKKYADFQGRATRREYWTFVLFTYIASTLAGFADRIVGTDSIANLVFIALLMPYFSVTARRMHDVGKSGWFMLIPFYNFILTLMPSIAPDPTPALDGFQI